MIGADISMFSNATSSESSTSGNFSDDLSSSLALLLPRNWSPRAYLATLNEALASGTLDRAEWWNYFVYTYWSESPAALKVRLGGEAEYDIPTCMLGHFFACWQTAMGLTRLQLLLAGVNEGILPAGFPFLTASGGSVESLGLHGSLLVRQHVRGRLLFDPTGKLIQMELAIIAHDEYLLSVRAGALVAANFPPLSETTLANPFICQWGFPASVHRLLDILTVLIRDVSNWLGTEDYPSTQNHQNPTQGTISNHLSPPHHPGIAAHLQQMQQAQMQQLQWQQLANVQQLLFSPVAGVTKKSHGSRVGSRSSPAGGKKKKRPVAPRPDLGVPTGSAAVMTAAVSGSTTPMALIPPTVDISMTGSIGSVGWLILHVLLSVRPLVNVRRVRHLSDWSGGHAFHTPCICLLRTQAGRRSTAKCPLCRVSIRGVLPLFLNLQREGGTRTSLSGEGSGGDNVDGVNENLMIFDTTPPLENAALLTESHDIRGNDLITVEGFGEELQQLRRQYEGALADIEQLEAARNETTREIEELEQELESLNDYLDRLTTERLDLSQSLQRSETELQAMRRERDRLRVHLSTTQEELSGSQHEILELRAELEGMRTIRLAKETERLLGEMSELETSEYLASLQSRPRTELEVQFSLLTLQCRAQERDIEKLKDDLRVSRVEVERSQRQVRRMKATTGATPETTNNVPVALSEPSIKVVDRFSSTIGGGKAIPTKRPPLIEISNGGGGENALGSRAPHKHRSDAPSTNTESSTRVIGDPAPPSVSFLSLLPLPPKFSATRWQATVPDGSGGQRRALKVFPPSRPL